MGNFRTTEALLDDLDVPVTHKEALRQDVFKYFYHFTGSEKKTCKLPRSSISDHIDAFIDAEEGREWFKRSPETDSWVHSRFRPQVARALTELTMKWLKSRRAVLSRKDDASSSRKKSTPMEDTSSGTFDRPAMISGGTTAFTAVNTKQSSRNVEHHEQILDHTDEETDTEPEVLENDDHNDDESLMDINEVLSTPIELSAKQLSPAPKTVRREHEENINARRHGLELSRPTSSNIAELVKQAGRKSRTPGSPPVTGSKRAVEDTISVVKMPADNKDSPEGVARKRVRPASESVPRQSSMLGAERATQHIIQRFDSLPSTTPTYHATSSTAEDERQLTPEALKLVTVLLSKTNSSEQKAIYDVDTLGEIPAVVLDYIGKCGQSSLAKANAANLGPLERRQYQERCRLFRDLYADIESRLLSLVHGETGEEHKTGETGLDAEIGSLQRGKVQVSSFCLWD